MEEGELNGSADGGALVVTCQDGFVIHGRIWRCEKPFGTVIINSATGVLARYYRFYARYLCENGFTAITYDYRGIGQSRPPSLHRSGISWWDWGELDFDTVAAWALADCCGPVNVVGHSIGGFLPGFAGNAVHLQRILTVGAQHAFWPDYARRRRAMLFLKWHIAMPALTAAFGYFPGQRLGWLEDLPKGVANTWSFGGRRFDARYSAVERRAVQERFAAVRAPILAIGLSDDEFGTPRAIQRALQYYTASRRIQVLLSPVDLGTPSIGHFGAFHSRFRDNIWPATVAWLRDGKLIWPLHKSE